MPGTGNSMCKDPEVGQGGVGLSSSKYEQEGDGQYEGAVLERHRCCPGKGLGASLRDVLAKTPKAKTSRSLLSPTGCGLCTAPAGGVLHLCFLSSWVRAPGSCSHAGSIASHWGLSVPLGEPPGRDERRKLRLRGHM